ncbi:NAD-dependent protein deacetylase sirtuin-1 [Bombina bombina]|uniref:NAD-dependent protein deacetylase sirtuin-1 n=1 Tax=Bombina bombina TaxID=8345 RepID=UPI00235AFD20|nr:NAD-dependent protein deacetylase sirtuin-1 [Bombina bombina]
MADMERVGLIRTACMLSMGKGNGEPNAKRQRTEEATDSGQVLEMENEGSAVFTSAVISLREEGEASADSAANTRSHNSAEAKGLPVEERQRMMLLVHHDDEEEEEELANGDLSQSAIGYGESIHFHDDFGNGFHSCDSDEDDAASHASSSDWTPKPCIGPYTFVQRHLMMGTDPRTILKDLLPDSVAPPELDDMTLWQIVINILSDPPKRKKRKDINTIEDAVKLLQQCKKIIVLTGAGVSVSCGIPDFRSRDGIYARLAVDFPDLPNPQAMFDIEYFRKDPRPFFKFAKEIYPGQFQPSLCHKFIAMLDKEGKLLRNYTQNIDTLEQVAGIQRIIQCHGSFATASCLICKYKVDCEVVREDIFNQIVPRCPRCSHNEPLAIMKPDIVFFGENLPEQFHRAMKYDKNEADLLIVIGSSLKVRPVALIPSSIPHDVPQILINREPLSHLHFDIELLGDCDIIINELCQRLEGKYTQLCNNSLKLSQITEKPPRPNKAIISSDISQPNSLNTKEDYECQGNLVQPENNLTESENICDSTKSELSQNCIGGNTDLFPTDNTQKSDIGPQSELTESAKGSDPNSVDQEIPEKDSYTEPPKKCLENKFIKEQISKRLDGEQYLFLAPNRYIFHGAEVFSDSDDDLSSSSCGTNSDSDSLPSPSLQEPIEEDSENEEFYDIKYDNDSDIDNRAGLEDDSEKTVIYENNDILGTDGTSTTL